MPERGPFLVDTVTLSNFALAGRLDILTERYPGRLWTTTTVLDEVIRGIGEGHPLQDIVDLAEQSMLEVIALSPSQRQGCLRLQSRLGSGEASLIAVAVEGGATVVTDDRVARDACRERQIPVTGTIGILRATVRDGQISVQEADETLARMVRAGFFSPVSSISSTIIGPR